MTIFRLWGTSMVGITILIRFSCGIAWSSDNRCSEAFEKRVKNSSRRRRSLWVNGSRYPADESIWLLFYKIITVKRKQTPGNVNFSCRIHSNDQVAQTSEQAPVTFEIVSSMPTWDSWHLCEEFVNALPTLVGLLRVLRFRNTDRVVRVLRFPWHIRPQ